jgi:TetR/AcrR family transcriptional regulator of autoinduction and epiphytic fitness
VSGAVARRSIEEPKQDGRHARAARTHHAIVSALLDLADEGELAPTAQAIATRAKVALRSIRQHFPTREELFVAAAEEHARRVAQAKPAELPAATSLSERISRFITSRARQLEGSSALRRAAALVEPKSPTVRQSMRSLGKIRRREVESIFAPELAELSRAERETATDALDVATNGKTWDTLRHDMSLSQTAASNVVKLLVTNVLGASK